MRLSFATAIVVLSLSTCRAAESEAARKGPNPLAETIGPKVAVLEYDHGDVSPWIEFFAFDSRRHPKMMQLRQQYRLDDKVDGCRSDLERAVALKQWVSGALKFGTPAEDVFDDWSAVALLERAEKGQVVWCGQAAMVFQQACWTLGMPARYIECGRPENPACHFTAEVFLREFDKWAVIDATPLDDFDLYYTVDGVPQESAGSLPTGCGSFFVRDRTRESLGTYGPAAASSTTIKSASTAILGKTCPRRARAFGPVKRTAGV